MKKLVSTVFAAVLGGVVAVTSISFIQNNQMPGGKVTLTQKAPVVYTSYSGTNMGNTPDFTMSAEKSLNAVVHIRTTTSQSNNLNYNPFEQFLYGHSNRSYVMEGSGSGVILSQDGYIVTNNHVVNGADEIEVMLNDKRDYRAEVIGTDPSTDIALLKIKEKDLPFISYGNSEVLKV